MSSSSRPGSPLATRGPRKSLACSPAAWSNASRIATQHGVPLRKLVDAALEDSLGLELVAVAVAERLGLVSGDAAPRSEPPR